MFGWSAKCGTQVQKYHWAAIRGNGKTDFCLGFVAHGLCTCFQVINLEFDPRHKSVLSHSLSACDS